MAALLTSETSKPENVVKYISECREMDIAVVPPNVQVSDANFTPGPATGHPLRPGGDQERGPQRDRVDHSARAKLADGREAGFAILWEFCEKVDLRLLNKRVLESLIKAGAMDTLWPPRPADGRPRQGDGARAEIAARSAAGQHGLFGGCASSTTADAASEQRTGRCPAQRAGVG